MIGYLKIILAVALLHGAMSCNAATITGVVVGVYDGDTITVLDDNKQQHKIRLLGIDSPERRQAFGARSKQNLSRLVYKKNVVVVYDKKDRWKRLLGQVFLNNVDINLVQVEGGMAWWFERYQKNQTYQDRLAYSYAHVKARKNGVGLWVDTNPMPPWEYRKIGRSRK